MKDQITEILLKKLELDWNGGCAAFLRHGKKTPEASARRFGMSVAVPIDRVDVRAQATFAALTARPRGRARCRARADRDAALRAW